MKEPEISRSEKRLKEVKLSTKAIHLTSPSAPIPCSLRGTVVEALHNANLEANIMAEHLMDNLFSNVHIEPTSKLFKSPAGLIFECQGIARVVPIEVDKIEVHLDFHVFPILDFDLLIGYPFEKHHLDSAS